MQSQRAKIELKKKCKKQKPNENESESESGKKKQKPAPAKERKVQEKPARKSKTSFFYSPLHWPFNLPKRGVRFGG